MVTNLIILVMITIDMLVLLEIMYKYTIIILEVLGKILNELQDIKEVLEINDIPAGQKI